MRSPRHWSGADELHQPSRPRENQGRTYRVDARGCTTHRHLHGGDDRGNRCRHRRLCRLHVLGGTAMTRWVKFCVGSVSFDYLADALKERRHEDGRLEEVQLVYAPTDTRQTRPAERAEPKQHAARRTSSRREVEDQLRAALIESGYSARQADQALAAAREKRKLRKVRKVRKVRTGAKTAQ